MKNLFEDISQIKEHIGRADGAVLLFDFDGVLSAIAPTPDDAIITKENLKLLQECSERFPTAIITGRTMADIKMKIDAPKIFYMASHGLEWEQGGKQHTKEIPQEMLDAIGLAKEKIKPLLPCYPGMIMEDKKSTFTAHYRAMSPELVPDFIKEVNSILEPIAREHGLRLDHSTKTFELRPEIDWDKGDSALFVVEHFQKKTGKKLVPIYLGDSLTDEDAFVALQKYGITIRVNSRENESTTSAAKWYLENQTEVGRFMRWILTL